MKYFITRPGGREMKNITVIMIKSMQQCIDFEKNAKN